MGKKVSTPHPSPESALQGNVARKRGRPRKDVKRESTTFSLSPLEIELLNKIQGVLGGSLSEVIGGIIQDTAKEMEIT
jgi:hypothetical protein